MNKRVMKIAGFVVLIGIMLGGAALGGIYCYLQKCAQENCKLAQQVAYIQLKSYFVAF